MLDNIKAITFLIGCFLANKTDNCLILDRSNNRNIISVSATGLGFYAWVLASEQGRIKRENVIEWINAGFDNIIRFNKKNKGWLYHFTDTSGKPAFDEQISTIDTAIFYAAAEIAAKRLGDKLLIQKVKFYKDKIDVNLMMNGGLFYHGFYWKNNKIELIPYRWDEYNEGYILYHLFDKPYNPTKTRTDLCLFTYYYPLAFYPNNDGIIILNKVIDYQIKNTGVFGFTACDGPHGYTVRQPDIVSPLAVLSCSTFFPAKSKKILDKFGVDPVTPSMLRNKSWISKDRVLVDDGIALILLSREEVLIINSRYEKKPSEIISEKLRSRSEGFFEGNICLRK